MKRYTLLFGLLCPLHGAVITWSAVNEITGDTSEIVDQGEYSGINTVTVLDLDGFNLAQPNPISDVTGTGSDITTVAGTFTAADYDSALNSFDHGFADILSSGLVVDETYYVQFFYSDQRADAYDVRTMIVGDGNGNEATLSSDGQYVIGTFIADGTSQTLEFNGSHSGAHLNMVAFATTSTSAPGVGTDTNQGTIPVPEPTSAVLLGFGSLALLARRRE